MKVTIEFDTADALSNEDKAILRALGYLDEDGAPAAPAEQPAAAAKPAKKAAAAKKTAAAKPEPDPEPEPEPEAPSADDAADAESAAAGDPDDGDDLGAVALSKASAL